MAFLLGSFTSGLFGGMSDMSNILNDWDTLKNKKDMRQAAQAVKTASQQSQATQNSMLPPVTNGPGYKQNGEPDLDSVPQPQPTSTSMPAVPVPPVPAMKPTPPNPNEGAGGGNTPTGASATTAALPTPRTAAPNYIASARGGVSVPQPQAVPVQNSPVASARGGYVPSTSQPVAPPLPPPIPPASALPQQPPIGRSSQATTPVVPTLASSQEGLGAQIMAAMNPVAGSTA